jgi:hypothetical protein
MKYCLTRQSTDYVGPGDRLTYLKTFNKTSDSNGHV